MRGEQTKWTTTTVSPERWDEDEPLGTKEKTWVTLDGDDRRWLLKLARQHGDVTRGEDWAEWVVAWVAHELNIPCAVVRPAQIRSRRGILSRNLVDVSASERLVHGNSLLEESNPTYQSAIKRENPGYTPQAVMDSLEGVAAPTGWNGPNIGAFGVWAGYVMLDALVAGRDRHHENWGVITSRQGKRLAETYDHGNALGFQEPPDRHRIMCENDQRRASWLGKGKSHHFAGRPTLVALATECLDIAGLSARTWWVEQLRDAQLNRIEDILGTVPETVMSVDSRMFVLKLLADNQRRLLDVLQGS